MPIPLDEALGDVLDALRCAVDASKADILPGPPPEAQNIRPLQKSGTLTKSGTDGRRITLQWEEGETLEERRDNVIRKHLANFPAHEVGDLDELPRDDMFKLLEDPLSSSTRTARRNLVAASGLGLFIGVFHVVPSRIPGVDAQIKPWQVFVALIAVLVWELVAFWLYADNDSKRRAIAEKATAGVLSSLRELVKSVESSGSICSRLRDEHAQVRLKTQIDGIVGFARAELERYASERRSATGRKWFDAKVPLAIGVVALAFVLYRLWRAAGSPWP